MPNVYNFKQLAHDTANRFMVHPDPLTGQPLIPGFTVEYSNDGYEAVVIKHESGGAVTMALESEAKPDTLEVRAWKDGEFCYSIQLPPMTFPEVAMNIAIGVAIGEWHEHEY